MRALLRCLSYLRPFKGKMLGFYLIMLLHSAAHLGTVGLVYSFVEILGGRVEVANSKVGAVLGWLGVSVQGWTKLDMLLPVCLAGAGFWLVKGITQFGKEKRHEDKWSRSPNTTGQGAIHVKTFHAKLTSDALEYVEPRLQSGVDFAHAL